MSRSLVTAWVTPLSVVRAVSRWPVHSQLHARRNALVASTELAARTHERRQVEQYLDRHVRARQTQHGTTPAGTDLAGGTTPASRLRAAL